MTAAVNTRSNPSNLKDKKLAIFVWYRSLNGGGLHENIYDTIRQLRNELKEITVVCPVGNYSERFFHAGARVVEVNFDNYIFDDVYDEIGSVDLIHLHPGESRVLGLKYAAKANIPAVITIHGAWHDQLATYESAISYIVTVSRHIEEVLRKQMPSVRHRLCTIENGIDCELFDYEELAANENSQTEPYVICVSRYDKDKEKMINFMLSLWARQSEKNIHLKWLLVGDGTLLPYIKEKAAEIFADSSQIEFVGWKEKEYLPEYYRHATCGYLPGRSAIEAMACGLPVIASGSSGGIKIIKNTDDIHEAAYSNFGGSGSETFSDDENQCLNFMIQCRDTDISLRKIALSTEIQRLFSIDKLSHKLLGLYSRTIQS